MRLSLRLGIPLLVVLLVGSGMARGGERTLLLVAAMAVALWTAFSLPRPRPPAEPPGEPEDLEEDEGYDLEEDEDEALPRR